MDLLCGYARWGKRAFVANRLTGIRRSEEHTSELQSQTNLVCRLLLEKKEAHRSPRRGPAATRCARIRPASWRSGRDWRLLLDPPPPTPPPPAVPSPCDTSPTLHASRH